LYIGRASAPGSTRFFSGLIDDVRIYNAAIPISQIKEQYYEGLNNLLVTGGINKEEYIEKIQSLSLSN